VESHDGWVLRFSRQSRLLLRIYFALGGIAGYRCRMASDETSGEASGRRRLSFPLGLFGLPELTEFEVASFEGGAPFMSMTSVGADPVEFVVVDPAEIDPEYRVELREEDADHLGIGSGGEARAMAIVTIRSHTPQFATVNLAGPIVTNLATGRSAQVILANSANYSTHHILVDERPLDSESGPA
jgi:flagellar assembly factor FliW